ncbi:hypothetical protein [uncultured Salinicola sp.]|uniref:hypothetical protein n=1 Tax=uncultured Salinicola sp. TaxID=1193542 RepID=UPI00262E9C7E|nr:hypothetical protein [uncultured Salinicola sp.]|tara:strand:+ start:1400 stop:1687 length:288 start_codon:yes stop_codon:yes gene_type:complete
MARYNLATTKAMILEKPEQRARITVPVEILRFCGASEVAARLREDIRRNGLQDNISMERGILYHTVKVQMEGRAIDMIPILEKIERLGQDEEEEE